MKASSRSSSSVGPLNWTSVWSARSASTLARRRGGGGVPSRTRRTTTMSIRKGSRESWNSDRHWYQPGGSVCSIAITTNGCQAV
jgi:hypothetical protein